MAVADANARMLAVMDVVKNYCCPGPKYSEIYLQDDFEDDERSDYSQSSSSTLEDAFEWCVSHWDTAGTVDSRKLTEEDSESDEAWDIDSDSDEYLSCRSTSDIEAAKQSLCELECSSSQNATEECDINHATNCKLGSSGYDESSTSMSEEWDSVKEWI